MTLNANGYIVGFNRDRDSYQVPRSIAEVAPLIFVTDYYHGQGLSLKRLSHRRMPEVVASSIIESRTAFAAQALHAISRRANLRVRFPSSIIDSSIARNVARQSRQHPEASLLVYSNYAYLAFRQRSAVENILFQYHPGRTITHQSLQTDSCGLGLDWSPEPEYSSRRRAVYEEEIASAQRTIVASSFTKEGLVLDGVNPATVSVVPYGCPTPEADAERPRGKTILYVGQGIRRKGLHILLRAWQDIDRQGFALRVVSSALEPAMARELSAASGVAHVSGATGADVRREMLNADIVVVPSLVEGFGLVIGEAFSRGCRVLATDATGLRDLKAPGSIAQVVARGDNVALTSALATMFSTYEHAGEYRQAAVRFAEEHSWSGFRAGVQDVLVDQL